MIWVYALTVINSLQSQLTAVGLAQAGGAARTGGNDEADDEAVQTERLSEDKDQDHTDVEPGLLGVGADTRITDDTDGHTGREGGHPDGEPRTEVRVAREGTVALGVGQLLVDDHRGNEAVDSLKK